MLENHMPSLYRYNSSYNEYYILREDLLPFSYGGNKLRKNINFFKEIVKGKYNHVVSYGSNHSNHTRIVANLCAKYNIECTIITPITNDNPTLNTKINTQLNVRFIYTELKNVSTTIERNIQELKKSGAKPYFIPGGAHGYLGTKAYISVYDNILNYNFHNKLEFDYIFLASGTGATQAGIVISNYLHEKNTRIIGISIARTEKHGRSVIQESIREYFDYEKLDLPDIDITFIDDYLSGGYGEYNVKIENIIKKYYKMYGIPLDPVYTGKAAYGMHEYLEKHNIKNKKVLFIHTGGTPLFFDYVQEKLQ